MAKQKTTAQKQPTSPMFLDYIHLGQKHTVKLEKVGNVWVFDVGGKHSNVLPNGQRFGGFEPDGTPILTKPAQPAPAPPEKKVVGKSVSESAKEAKAVKAEDEQPTITDGPMPVVLGPEERRWDGKKLTGWSSLFCTEWSCRKLAFETVAQLRDHMDRYHSPTRSNHVIDACFPMTALVGPQIDAFLKLEGAPLQGRPVAPPPAPKPPKVKAAPEDKTIHWRKEMGLKPPCGATSIHVTPDKSSVTCAECLRAIMLETPVKEKKAKTTKRAPAPPARKARRAPTAKRRARK